MNRVAVISLSVLAFAGTLFVILPGRSVEAQRNRTYIYDSGVVPIGPDQMLIGMLVPSAVDGSSGPLTVRSREIQYAQQSCTGNVCTDIPMDDWFSAPVQLNAFEDMRDGMVKSPTASAVRMIFQSSSANVKVTGHIVDVPTGKIVSTFSFGATNQG